MNPEDEEKYRFGSSLDKRTEEYYKSGYVPYSQLPDVFKRPTPKIRAPYIPYRQLEESTPVAVTDIEELYRDNPRELERQRAMQRVDRRLEAWQRQVMQDKPEYRYALLEPDNQFQPFNAFTRGVLTGKFAIERQLEKEKAISQEFTLLQRVERQARRTGAVGRFLVSVLQDIYRAGTDIGIVTPYEFFAKVTGKLEPDEYIKVGENMGDNFLYKWLFGTERERDMFGRVISEKAIPLVSIGQRAKAQEEMFRKGQSEEEKKTLWGKAWPIFASKFGSVGMFMLEIDPTVLPLAGVKQFLKSSERATVAVKKMVEATKDIAEKSGVEWTKSLETSAKSSARKALNADNSLESQKIVNELIRDITPEGSVGRQIVDDIESSINREMSESRATLDSLAVDANTYDDFVSAVSAAILRDRARQRRVIQATLDNIVSEPTFVEAQARAAEIYTKFGKSASEKDIATGALKDNTPKEIVDEFNNLKTQLADITDNTITPLTNQLLALSDNIEVGRGPFDLTKNLLNDSGKDLGPFLREVYDNAKGRAVSAVRTLNVGSVTGKTDNEILDMLDMIQRQIADMRAARRKSTAVEKMGDYLYAEAVARGAIARRSLLEAAKETVRPVGKVVKKVEKPAVSPVNDKVFKNVKLSIGDTLLKAADDVAKSSSFEDFVKNSDEVVYQTDRDLVFVRDKKVSDEMMQTTVNPPVVLDMRQPLMLTDKSGAMWEVARKVRPSIKDGKVFKGEEVEELLKDVAPFGFDGVIYKGVSGSTERVVSSPSQVIPAASFYDNIKSGVDTFKDGVSLVVRRQSQPEDILEKMLPKTVGFKGVENDLIKAGVPVSMAARVTKEYHAMLLDSYLQTLKKDGKFLHSDTMTYIDDSGEISLSVTDNGTHMRYKDVAGTETSVQIRDRKQTEVLYKHVINSFERDTKQRIKNLAEKRVAGSITEADFAKRGPGHASFIKVLNQRIKEGVFLPEEAAVVRAAMKDVDDTLLEKVPLLSQASRSFSGHVLGRYIGVKTPEGFARNSEIFLRRGLAFYGMREMKSGKVNEAAFDSASVFLHEFGHLGYFALLSPEQRKTVKKVYDSLSKSELRELMGRGPSSTRNIKHVTHDEKEFFAQAFAEYTMRNKVTHQDLVPLFERVRNQLKAALSAVLRKPSNTIQGKMDALTPLFEQVLRGESSSRAANVEKVTAEFAAEKLPKRTPIGKNRQDIGARKEIVSRKAIEDAKKLLRSVPGGKGIPEDIRKGAGKVPPVKPPKSPDAPKPYEKMLDAKIPQKLADMDPFDPRLPKILNDKEMFGPGTRVHRSLRQGQIQLARTVRKMQERLIRGRKEMADSMAELRRQRDAAAERGKLKFKTAKEAKDNLDKLVKAHKKVLRAFGTNWSTNDAEQIARMMKNVNTQKALIKAENKLYELFDARMRKKATEKIGKIIKDTEQGTSKIPPKWQERIEDAIGHEGIRLKLFKTPYEERLKKLQKYLEEHPDVAEKFRSPKTLAMLEDLKEMQKKVVTEFQTSELVKLTMKIDELYKEGRAAHFVIHGGKTRERFRWVVKVDPNTGKATKKKFIIEKGGEYVEGLNELYIKNQAAIVTDAAEKGHVVNLDHGVVQGRKIGEMDERSTTRALWDGFKGLAAFDQNAWQRGLMTYLTSDRVFELMDNMDPRGTIYRLIGKPLKKAVNEGEKAGQDKITALLNKEKSVEKKYGVKLQDANYERIAIHAYIKQGATNKLENVVPKDTIRKIKSEGLKPYEQEIYEHMRDELDKMWPEVDKVMREQHEVRIGKIEHYFPIQNRVLDNRTMADVMAVEFTPKKRAVQKFFTEKRYTNTPNAEMSINARDIYKKHMRDVNYFVKVEPEIKRISALAKNEDFVKATGINANQWFADYIDIVARRGTPKNYDFNWVDTARKNLGAATLGYNPSPVIKQPLAVAPAMGILGAKRVMVDGFGLMQKYKLMDDIGEVSAEQALRAADDPAYVDLALKGKLSELQEMGYRGIKYTDKWTARGVWLAAYTDRLAKKGKKFNPADFKNKIGIDQDALDYADYIVRKTQGSGKFQDLPLMLTNKNKKLFTYLFQFQSFVLGQSQMLTHDALYSWYKSFRGVSNMPIRDATGKVVKITAYVGAGIYAEMMISRGLVAMYGSEGSKKRIEEQTKLGVANEMLSSAIPPYGLVSDLFQENQTNLGVPVIDKTLGLIRSASKAAHGSLASPETLLKESTRMLEAVISLGTGVPGTTFTGGLLRNVVIEPAFRTPAEKLKEAIKDGDTMKRESLLREFKARGYDVDEIKEKVVRSFKNDKKRERAETVDKLVYLIEHKDDPGGKKRLAEYSKKLEEKGLLTPELKADVVSEIKSRERKRSIGEL